MHVAIRLPRSTAEACRDESLWYEIEPELKDELIDDPDHFWESLQATIEVLSITADAATVIIASHELGRFLRRLIERSRRSKVEEDTTITATGPGGELSLRLAAIDPTVVESVATLMLEVQKTPDP